MALIRERYRLEMNAVRDDYLTAMDRELLPLQRALAAVPMHPRYIPNNEDKMVRMAVVMMLLAEHCTYREIGRCIGLSTGRISYIVHEYKRRRKRIEGRHLVRWLSRPIDEVPSF
jgi:hypothetical protein